MIMIAQQLAPVLAFITQLLSTAAAVSRIGTVPALIAKVPGAWCRSRFSRINGWPFLTFPRPDLSQSMFSSTDTACPLRA